MLAASVGCCAGAAVGTLLMAVREIWSKAKSKNVVRHVVLFKFKAGAPINDVVAAFDSLSTKQLSHLVLAYERGTQCSPEGLGKDLTHAFALTFPNEAARDQYLPHPLHQKFVETWAKPYVEDVCVFDYNVA
eukprot:TRINITY_DN304_c2_g1_i1.p1 TRINITY_DN304_c2_g1~~TRINITY_DN304_c2_g1_i1.p1  ORF type:complete len:132 (+),score=16.17 TRINITY_DN304_c2_g1_i1:177-572(+)